MTPDLESAVALWNEGKTMTEMAAALGPDVTRNQVAGLIARNRARFEMRQKQKEVPPETVDAAARLWATNASEETIVAELGFRDVLHFRRVKEAHLDRFPSRRCVSAKLKADMAQETRRAKAARAAVRQTRAPANDVEDLDVATEAAAPPTRAESFRPLAGQLPIAVEMCGGCRWPVHAEGDPMRETARFFCGAVQDRGSSYCATHRAVGTVARAA
jgi:hypothetical protein